MSELSLDLKECLELAVALASEAGKLISAGFHVRAKTVIAKSSSVDVVTETDKACESLIVSGIRAKFPLHRIIAEESFVGDRFEFTDSPTWLIDPVDGTTNFVHSFPFVCVSIALNVHRRTVVAVVYNPIMNELFTATKAGGAFLNGRPIHVSEQSEFSKCSIVTEFGYDRTEAGVAAMLARLKEILLMKVHGVRSIGSCALNLCGVACGRHELYYEGKDHAMGPKPWDIAAGALIVSEAGGCCCDVNGDSLDIASGRVLASNRNDLAGELVRILSKVEYK